VNVELIGLNTPTEVAVHGTKTTFPFGVKTPPWNLKDPAGIPDADTAVNVKF